MRECIESFLSKAVREELIIPKSKDIRAFDNLFDYHTLNKKTFTGIVQKVCQMMDLKFWDNFDEYWNDIQKTKFISISCLVKIFYCKITVVHSKRYLDEEAKYQTHTYIKTSRYYFNVSAKDVADAIGISLNRYLRIEEGTEKPTIAEFLALSKVLNFSYHVATNKR